MQNTGHYFGTQQEYARMFEMIFGAHTSQIVHTAALYSLSEHLAEGRNTPTEIAAVESLHVDATFRLMRACAAIGLMTYDFFANPLPPADLFLLKLILHDWNDDAGLAILRNCRRSISAGGRILVVEQLIDEIGTPGFTPLLDLNMLVLFDGRERTLDEFKALFTAAGFRFASATPTSTPFVLIEAVTA